ncbi:MAG: hypothetical protein EOP86_23370 [Verrucomicrobiaceae bacterium]|nr:MAG: hypothetical protein EOP86_23370 [Verrucomicrobiaceae bacterium]
MLFIFKLLLIAIPAAAALWLLQRAALAESRATRGRRVISYPRVLRTCTLIGWAVAVAAPWAAWQHGMISQRRSIILMMAGLGLALLFHFEIRRSKITWDGYWIYTISPWRKDRRIAFASVTECGFSYPLLSHIIRTRKDGPIFLPIFLKGVSGLLQALPEECLRNVPLRKPDQPE